MEVMNKGDKRISSYPISFTFNKEEKVKILSYGKEITDLDDDDFEKMTGLFLSMLMERTDKDMIVYNMGKKIITAIKTEEK